MGGERAAKKARTEKKVAQPKKEKHGAGWQGEGQGFNDQVVKNVYRNLSEELASLELKQYLEKYLYPHLSATSSLEHLMSVAALTVEKHNQGLDPFLYVGEDVDKFALLMKGLAALDSLPIAEKKIRVMFLNTAFNSLEVDTVRKVCLPLVHISLWMYLSSERVDEELKNAPTRVRKQYNKLAAEGKKGEKLESKLMPSLLSDFTDILETVSQQSSTSEAEATQTISYLERSADMMIDLLSQLPTRRFFRPLLDDMQVIVKSRRIIASAVNLNRLNTLSRLLDLVDFYIEFEINDHTGEPLSRESVIERQCERLSLMQTMAFRMYPEELRDLALSNQGSIEQKETLLKHLRNLKDDQLLRFAAALQCIPKEASVDRSFAEEAILHRYCRRRTQAESFKREPLYPTEELIWNSSAVPPSDFKFANRSLALPKINLQFLTMYDYLLRNYTLYRLESTSEIRDDLESVIQRMRPRLADQGQLVFDGWARMAATVKGIKVIDKKPPRLDAPSPRSVLCEVEYDLRKLPLEARREWDETKEHDVMFLVSMDVPEVAPGDENESSTTFAQAHGVSHVRGLEVSAMLDADGKEVREWEAANAVYAHGNSPFLRFRAFLDPVQYFLDEENGISSKLYENRGCFSLLIRRKTKENNFKAILETIRNLIGSSESETNVPGWLHDIFLGYGNPGAATYYNLEDTEGDQGKMLDFYDTFVSEEHLQTSFPDKEIVLPQSSRGLKEGAEVYFKVEFDDEQKKVVVDAYDSSPIYRVGEKPKRNPVPFTPTQVAAIRSGMEKGLTLVVGPPGTGKTDVVVQIVANLYRSYPEQRILIVTHSNHALNDVFEKIMQRDVDERHLLRLGQGEKALATEKSFSKIGRVNFMLQKRIDRLNEVSRLAKSLNLEGDYAYTSETASLFFSHTIRMRWEKFQDEVKRKQEALVRDLFPFTAFFPEAPFSGEVENREKDLKVATICYEYLEEIFQELAECRSMELLRNNRDRGDFLLVKQARIIAMTCTHAAMRRDEFVRLGLQYDSLVMEEAGQVLEVETLIPMLLQKPRSQSDGAPLQRVVLVGDHNQLPPIVKNPALQKYARMGQSLFSRFIRLGNPAIELDMQGRARSKLADLYRWRYTALGDLKMLTNGSVPEFARANPGFAHEFQVVDVGRPDSESQPVPFFYQNIVEAEFIAALYQYMRLIGYPAEKITVLTTYNGQKNLIKDVISARIQWNPSLGMPGKISTVDKYQGRQNDYVLLSLVRTRNVGHIRDVRRLVVAMSRARLGLYVFCRKDLFSSCIELAPTFKLLAEKPSYLELRSDERYDSSFRRDANKRGKNEGILKIRTVDEMANVVSTYATKLEEFFRAQASQQPLQATSLPDESKVLVAQE